MHYALALVNKTLFLFDKNIGGGIIGIKVGMVMKKVAMVIIFFISLLMLSSCQSTNKTQSFFYIDLLDYTCEYDSINHKTKVIWSAPISNQTIYDIKQINVTFNLYNKSVLIQEDSRNYTVLIEHGEEETTQYTFTVDYEIDKIEFQAWEATHASFWETYNVWIIITSVIAIAIAIIYIIVMIIQDLDFDDIVEHLWVFSFVLIILIPMSVYGSYTTSWIPVCIVLAGICSAIIVILLGHLIKEKLD